MKQTKDSLVKPIRARTRNKDRLTKDCKLLSGAPHLPVVTCCMLRGKSNHATMGKRAKIKGRLETFAVKFDNLLVRNWLVRSIRSHQISISPPLT